MHAILTSSKTLPAAAIAAASLLLAFAGSAADTSPWVIKPAIPAKQQLFPQSAVRLLDGPFKAMQEVDHAYLIRLEPDRLLAQFRVEAGLQPKAKPYGGWESPAQPGTVRSLAGHSLGHYLSAPSLIARVTDDPALRERITYITPLSELAWLVTPVSSTGTAWCHG